MQLTIDELKTVIRDVARNLIEKKAKADKKGKKGKKDDRGEKGRDGYVEEDIQPVGFGSGGKMDFSKDAKESLEGSRYKRQGNSNMGPWTSESALRSIVRAVMAEEFKLKPMPNVRAKESAPYNVRSHVGEQGSVGNPKMEGWKTTKQDSTVWEQLAHWYDVPTMKESRSRLVETKFVGHMEMDAHGRRLKERLSGREGPR